MVMTLNKGMVKCNQTREELTEKDLSQNCIYTKTCWYANTKMLNWFKKNETKKQNECGGRNNLRVSGKWKTKDRNKERKGKRKSCFPALCLLSFCDSQDTIKTRTSPRMSKQWCEQMSLKYKTSCGGQTTSCSHSDP